MDTFLNFPSSSNVLIFCRTMADCIFCSTAEDIFSLRFFLFSPVSFRSKIINNSLSIHCEKEKETNLYLTFFSLLRSVECKLCVRVCVCVCYDTSVSPSVHSVYVDVSAALLLLRSARVLSLKVDILRLCLVIVEEKEKEKEQYSMSRQTTHYSTVGRADCRRSCLEISFSFL